RSDLAEELLHEVDLLDRPVGERSAEPLREESRDLALRVNASGQGVLTLLLVLDGVEVDREVVPETQRARDEALGHAAELLRLRVRGLDPLVEDQVAGEVTEHRATVAGVAAELPTRFPVTHGESPSGARALLTRRDELHCDACCAFQRSSI